MVEQHQWQYTVCSELVKVAHFNSHVIYETKMGTIRGTFAAGDDGHTSRLAPHTEDDRPLHPGDEEVGTLAHHMREDPSESVKYHCPLSSID